MKFIINKSVLVNSLNTVTKIASTKSIDAILNNLKFTISQQGLEIVGSNGDVSIIDMISRVDNQGNPLITIDNDGSFLVSTRVSDIVRSMEGNELAFEIVDGTVLKINDSKSSFRLNTMNAKEYPDLDFNYRDEDGFLISKEVFIQAVNQVAFVASTKDTKPILKAVNITCDGGRMTLVATDTARLSRKIIEVPFNKKIVANVPAKTLMDVSKMLDNATALQIIFGANRVVFKFGTTILYSSLMAGDYPNIASIISKKFTWNLQVSANELIGALERVSVLFLDKARENAAKLTLSENVCKLTSRSAQFGSTEEIISMFKYDGEPLEIAFNCDFALAAIKATGKQDIIMYFGGEIKPFMIKAVDDENFVQIITPLRIND
jgi:DNA polymerase-3 subunit beta